MIALTTTFNWQQVLAFSGCLVFISCLIFVDKYYTLFCQSHRRAYGWHLLMTTEVLAQCQEIVNVLGMW